MQAKNTLDQTPFHINETLYYIEFCKNHLLYILNMLGIHRYAIGGSVAAFLYGAYLGRAPHDIDVIVPKNTNIIELKKRIAESPLFAEMPSSYCPANVAIKTAKSPIIDIIVENSKYPAIENVNRTGIGIGLVPFECLVKSKADYNREKDNNDLILLKEVALRNGYTKDEFDALSRPTSATKIIGDIETLEAIKKELEATKK